jgi:hypothetical protein
LAMPRSDTPAPDGGRAPALLNQEDLLTLLLSLSITVFEVLERFGIAWRADEQEAYLHLWDVVGHYLGIGTNEVIDDLVKCFSKQESAVTTTAPVRRGTKKIARNELVPSDWIGLRPPTVAGTRALLAQLRERQWPDVAPTSPLDPATWSGARAGRALIKSLLDELSEAMPRPLALLPISVIRVLAPEIVRKRLSLGANGLVLGAVMSLPTHRVLIDQFTALSAPNRVSGRALRMMANDVTARAAVRFMQAPDFSVPGSR